MRKTSTMNKFLLAFVFNFVCAQVSGRVINSTVAADGSANFKTIQEAINAAPHNTSLNNQWVIFVKSGHYREHLHIQREKRFIHLIGENADKTYITFNLNANSVDSEGKPIGTFKTATTFIEADDFTAEDITFENSAGRVGQALAIRIDGDRIIFKGCRFVGWQDTILANRGRHYFDHCYIEGAVDFIFGAATAFFDSCHINCLGNGFITAASTPAESPYGFVFSHCHVSGQTSQVSTYLGRPWRPYAAVSFIHTEMSEVVRPQGWNNWDKAENEKTARYVEFGNTGSGSNTQHRVKWLHSISTKEADQTTPEHVLKGSDNWNPKHKL
jgi:pectinesterase